MEKQKTLQRSKTNRMIAGVCGGIGEYFDVDPTIVRIIFALSTFFGGLGLLLYIIGVIVIPDQDSQTAKENNQDTQKNELHDKIQSAASDIKENLTKNPKTFGGEQIFGLIIVFIGLSIFFGNFFPWFHLGKLWPIILIVIGLAFIFNRKKG